MEDDLKDLFQDTAATFTPPDVTPNVVSFAEAAPTSEGKKKKKPRAPRKKKENKRHKPYQPSVLSQYNDILNDDPFIVPDPLLPAEPTPEQKQKEKEEASAKQQVKKKRESLRHSVFMVLKEQGKSDQDIKTELKKVEQLSEEDVEFELHKIAFTQSEHFSDKVAQLIRDGAGWLAEKALRADGKIQKEVEQDKALKEALQKEMMSRVGMINLKGQIFLMLVGDILHGKAKASIPTFVTPIENNAEQPVNNNHGNPGR